MGIVIQLWLSRPPGGKSYVPTPVSPPTLSPDSAEAEAPLFKSRFLCCADTARSAQEVAQVPGFLPGKTLSSRGIPRFGGWHDGCFYPCS